MNFDLYRGSGEFGIGAPHVWKHRIAHYFRKAKQKSSLMQFRLSSVRHVGDRQREISTEQIHGTSISKSVTLHFSLFFAVSLQFPEMYRAEGRRFLRFPLCTVELDFSRFKR